MPHTRINRRDALVAAIAAVTGAPALAAPAGARPYRFSPVNQHGIELTASYWNPIIQYVSERSGVPLELKIGRTSADTISYVLANEVDFSFNNHLFTPEREKLGWKVFARRNSPFIRSQIVTLRDSPIRRLEDLKDQPVAFPGPEAVVAYKFSYAELLGRGIPVQVVFGGNHDGALGQLTSGRVKAVGVNAQVADSWSVREGKPLQVLWQSAELPELALMASHRVPAADFAAVRQAFVSMYADPAGRKVLAATSALVKLPADAQFVAATASDFNAYREFYRRAPAALQ